MNTRIVFGGGEVGSHRTLLLGMGVTSISVNYWRLRQRGLPTTKQYLFADRVPEGVDIYVDPGVEQVYDHLPPEQWWDYMLHYKQFLAANIDRVTGFNEFDPGDVYPRPVKDTRAFLVDEFGEDRFRAVWHHDRGPSLESLSDRFKHVAIPGESIKADTTLVGRLRALQGLRGTRWHGLAHAHPDDIRSLPLDTVSTLSWISPMMRGETVVWDGTSLKRYPAAMKQQARMRLAGVCERAGLDLAKIQDDDAKEVTRLAVWSYLQLQDRTEKNQPQQADVVNLSDYSTTRDAARSAEGAHGDADNSALEVRKPVEVISRPVAEQMVLPVFGIDTTRIVEKGEDGHDVVRDIPVVRSNPRTLRQCNTCFVAANCPAFKPDNECAFNLPVEVRTKEQLKSLLQAMLEMQGSRIAFARFSEELQGGYPDPNLSSEMDRMFRLVKILKELENNNEFVRMTVERQTSGGVLSAIFGPRATVTAPELPGGGLDADATNKLIDGGL